MTTIQLALTIDETNAVLEALGQLPYARVYTLIAKIQQQATTQLQADQSLSLEKQNPGGRPGENMGGM